MASLHRSLVEDIRALLRDTSSDDLSIGDIIDAAGERGFGLVFILFALPMLVPVLPPGTAAAVGLLFTILSLQMLFGRRKPWVPQSWRSRRVSPRLRQSTLEHAIPLLARLTRWSRPRWPVVTGHIGMRWAALCACAMGIVMVMPIPFMNTLPALSVLCIGVGLISGDGLFLMAGMGASGCIVALLVLAILAGGPLIEGMINLLPAPLEYWPGT